MLRAHSVLVSHSVVITAKKIRDLKALNSRWVGEFWISLFISCWTHSLCNVGKCFWKCCSCKFRGLRKLWNDHERSSWARFFFCPHPSELQVVSCEPSDLVFSVMMVIPSVEVVTIAVWSISPFSNHQKTFGWIACTFWVSSLQKEVGERYAQLIIHSGQTHLSWKSRPSDEFISREVAKHTT